MRLFTFKYNTCDFEFVVTPKAIPFEIVDVPKFLAEVFFRLIHSHDPILLNGRCGKQPFYLEGTFYNQDDKQNKICKILLISPGSDIQTVQIRLNETERPFDKFYQQFRASESECDPTNLFSPELILKCKECLPQLNERHGAAIKYISHRPSTGPKNEVLPFNQMTAELNFTNTRNRLLNLVRDDFEIINAHRKAFAQALETAKKALDDISALHLKADSLKAFNNLQQNLRVDLAQEGHLAKLDAAAAATQKTEVTSKAPDIHEQIDAIFTAKYTKLQEGQDNISKQKQPLLNAIYEFAKKQSEKIAPDNSTQRELFNKRFGKFAHISDQKKYTKTRNDLHETYRTVSFKELQTDIQKLIDSYEPRSIANRFKTNPDLKSLLKIFDDLTPPTGSEQPATNFHLNKENFTFQFCSSMHTMETEYANTKEILITELHDATDKLVKDNSQSIKKLGETTAKLISHIYQEMEGAKAKLIQCKIVLTHIDSITEQSQKLISSIAELLQALKSQYFPKANEQFSKAFSELLVKNEEQKLRLIADLEAQETVIKSILTPTINISQIEPREFTADHLEYLETASKKLTEISNQNGELLKKFQSHQKQTHAYLDISTSLERRIQCKAALDGIDQVALERTSAHLYQCLQDVEAQSAAEDIEREQANFKAELTSATEALARVKDLEDSIIQQLVSSHANAIPATDGLFKRLALALKTAETHKAEAVRLQQVITQSSETVVEIHVEVVRLCRVWVAKIESPDEWERHVLIGGSKLEPNSTTKNPKGIRLFHDSLRRQQAEPQAPAALLNQPGSLQEYYVNLDAAVLAKLAKDKDVSPKSTWITNGRQAIRVLNELKRLADTRRTKFSITRKTTTQDFYDELALLNTHKARGKVELIKREIELNKLVSRQPYVMPASLFDRKAFADQVRRDEKRKSKNAKP